MYKETLRHIAGIGLFPVVSLLMFVAVFTLVLLRVLRMDRAEAQRLATLPLERDEELAPSAREGWQ